MIDFQQRMEQTLKQTLEMALSPKMIQTLKILNLSYIDLIEKIKQETEENITLDVEKEDRLATYMNYIAKERVHKKDIPREDLPGIEAIENLPETLEEHLLNQLELEDLSPEYNDIAKYLIGNIDDRGFLNDYPKIKESIIKKFKVSPPTVDKILKTVQQFEPEGVGARDLKECLIIQVEEYSFENDELQETLEKAIKHHLEDIADKKFGRIAKSLDITEDGAKNLAEFIKNNLNPNPGSGFSSKISTVIPSFSIEKDNNKYNVVNLEKKYGPVIKLNPKYQIMLEDKNTDKATREFLIKKLGSAKELLENITRRHETIEKVLKIVAETQQGFFEKGVLLLKPLHQKEIAETVNVHPSTISRALAEKYIQTPQGLFQLKYLCPRRSKGQTVERTKKIIAQIVSSEKFSLSDEEIKNKLELCGIKIERRTIAEYRKELNIPSSFKRMKS